MIRPLRRAGPARALTSNEMRRLLVHVGRQRHALRNTTQVLLTCWAGLRVGEIAALRYNDVVDGQLRVRPEIAVPQGNGRPPRAVPLPARMRRQLAAYVNALPPVSHAEPLFRTQKREGWSAGTLAQHFSRLYRSAGFEGASSQSGRRSFVLRLARRSGRATVPPP